MNIEKEVTITELRGKFTKDLDTLTKMDPFLELSVGKAMKRTETAQEAGKDASWRDSIVLTYFEQTQLLVKAYDEDPTENEFIGMGKLQIKSLRFPGGVIEISLSTDSGQNIGTVTGKYTLKNLTQNPLLVLKNMKVQLFKESKSLLKAKPYLEASAEEGSMATDAKEEVVGTTMAWNDHLRLKIKENSKVTISLLDKTDNATIFAYECSAREFRLQNGSKKYNVLDKHFNQLGHLIFDFQTANLVSKEESVKNADKDKKADGELTAITVGQLTPEITKEGKETADIYYKIVVGTNNYKTDVVPNRSTAQVNQIFYAQAKEHFMFVVAIEKGLIADDVIGYAEIPLDTPPKGSKKTPLLDATTKEELGSVVLTLETKVTPAKSLLLDNIAINIEAEGDIVGTPEPYVVFRIGCCSGQTETSNEVKASFKQDIELKFGEEEKLEIQIWDEDVGNNDIIYSGNILLSELKPPKGQFKVTVPKKLAEGQSESSEGKVTFKYELKGVIAESPVRKVTQKKVETNRSQKEISEKEEVKKEPKKETVTAREKSQADLESQREKKPSVVNNEPISQRTEGQRQHSLNKNSISRSKETLNLPSIMSSFHQVYGDRIFDKQSAATLQRSIVAYSMPKGNRFSNEPKYSGEPSYCLDTCFKSNPSKGAGFGFGRKKQFPEWMERNMKDNPAPGSYFDSHLDGKSKGPTFGLGHKYYQRVMIPREQKVQPHTVGRKLSPIREPPSK